jgi:hypothetical protein
MRLGFDLDGTLADMHEALARVAKDLFPDVDPATLPQSAASEGDPTSAPPGDSPPPAGPAIRTARQQRLLWKEACSRENFWETLDEIEPGALGRLFRLVGDRRWEIIFLTSRPETEGDTAQAQSHRWLAAHGFPSPSIFVVHGSRGKIADALDLDVIVDDRPENCLDVATDSKARAILVWRGDESQIPGSARQLGIGVVRSIAECLDILESLERPDQRDQLGVVERLKRLLGLKPHPARQREPAPSASASDAVKVKS